MKLDYELPFYDQGINVIVGLDEAGRGCLLGPVVAAAVILPPHFYHPLINDSKQLTEKQREEVYQIIIDNALDYGIGECSVEEIDKMNILEASREAFMRAIRKIKIPYELVLTDFMKLPLIDKVEVIPLTHGDALSINIAAASILAKVTRDHYCYELEKQYPNFKIGQHKGYGTKEHMDELNKYGPVKGLHRFSYKPVKKFLVEKISLF